MSNTHEYVLFDRAELDRLLAMTWQQFEKIATRWITGSSTREFLLEDELDPENLHLVDRILERKTVRQTFRFCNDPFQLLRDLIYVTGMDAREAAIPKYDYDYDLEILSCAAGGYSRGELSWFSLLAVWNLHPMRRVDLKGVVPRALANTLLQIDQPSMLPGLPSVMTRTNGTLNVSDTRRFMKFLILAWDEEWPDIRSCEVAERLTEIVRDCDFAKPCIFQWYEH